MHHTTPTRRCPWTAIETDFQLCANGRLGRSARRRWSAIDDRIPDDKSVVSIAGAATGNDADAVGIAQALLAAATDDDLARKALFHAALPRMRYLARTSLGYASVAFRAAPVDGDMPCWTTPDDAAADVINLAFQWIAANAGTDVRHPVRSMRDWVRDQLRVAAGKATRHYAAQKATQVSLSRHGIAEAPPSAAAEQLMGVLIEAREHGIISRDDAGLLYRTTVLGNTSATESKRAHVHVNTINRRRRRAERLLREAAPMFELGVAA